MAEEPMHAEEDVPARRILLVEDDRSHRWVLRRLLENSFGEEILVEEASDGEAALTRAGRRPQIDLILLDLHLPDISGFDVLRRLRAERKTRGVPVVVLTSSREKADVARAYEYGANSFISKSESPELMFRQLRMLPVYWLELNRLPG
jgi:two-component system response regulator